MVLSADRPSGAVGVRPRALLRCGYLPAVFLLVILIEGAARPGYEPLHHFGSELSLSGRGWIQIANFVLAGAGTIAFAWGVRRTEPSGPGSIAFPVATGLVGVGLFLAGIFVTDPNAGYPPGVATLAEPTWHGWLHNINIVPVWVALTTAIAAGAYRDLRGRRWGWAAVSILAAIATPVTMVVAAGLYDMDTLSGRYHGLWQRVSMAIGFGWYAIHAHRLLRAKQSSG